MMRYHKIILIICLLFLVSCSALPPMSEATGGIPTSEIVLRVKCELAQAFSTADGRWLTDNAAGDYAWMRNWTTQTDLTLQILDTATFSPGATLTQPLPNGYGVVAGPSSASTTGVAGTAISSVQQNFAVAAAVGLNGQAQRTLTLSFNLALEELKVWRATPSAQRACNLSDGLDLDGRLGLKEWIAEATSPVHSKLLFAGIHPKPASAATASPQTPKSVPPPPASTATSGFATIMSKFSTPACASDTLNPRLSAVQKTYDTIMSSLTAAEKTSRIDASSVTENYQSALKSFSVLQKSLQAYRQENDVYSTVMDPHLEPIVRQNRAIVLSNARQAGKLLDEMRDEARLAKNYFTNIGKSSDESLKAAHDAIGDAETAISKVTQQTPISNYLQEACGKLDGAEEKAAVASASLSYVNYWQQNIASVKTSSDENAKSFQAFVNNSSDELGSLPNIDPPISAIGESVQFILNYNANATPTWTFVRFKGPNNPLFSAAGTRTHMLTISLGPPAPGTLKTPGGAVISTATNLLFENLLPSIGR